jgi:hypothetical protein
MSEQLEAAEALLATVQAARTRVALLTHRALPFRAALDLEIAYRVGNSSERILLETPRSRRELPPPRIPTAPAAEAPAAEAPAPAAPAPALEPPADDAPLDADAMPAAEEAPAPAQAPAEPDEEPTTTADAATVLAAAATAAAVLSAPADDALEEPTLPTTSAFALVDEPASENITLDDLVHEDLPAPPVPGGDPSDDTAPEPAEDDALLVASDDDDDELIIEEPTDEGEEEFAATTVSTASPALKAAIAASRRRELVDDDDSEDAPLPSFLTEDDEHEDLATTVADSPPELRAAIARERLTEGGSGAFVLAQPRSVGPRVGGAPQAAVPSPDDESTQVSRPAISLGAPRARTLGAPPADPGGGLEVIERGNEPLRPEPAGAAAIQILGVGKARTITPTLELGSADGPADDEVPAPDDVADDGSFSLGFVEPDEDVGDAIPELGAGDDGQNEAPAASILTPDGMIPSESGRVQEASDDDIDVRRFRDAAAQAERSGDLQGAVLAWGDVLDLRPSDAQAHLGRGRALVELRDYAAAMSDFQRAEDLAPSSALPLFEMGNLFFARMEYSKAIPFFDQAIEMDESHAMSWCRRGISHHHRKNHTQAVADLQQAAAIDPDIPGLRRYVQMAIKAMQKRRR